MNKVIIENIGPITLAEIDLNKVNIVMGPQSSGKSTIAKIVSFCQWVEKRYILDGNFTEDFNERFKEFHRISDSYFSDSSLIKYVSDSVTISYKGFHHKFKIEKNKNENIFYNSKNIYIPAERNFVSVIPNLGKYKGTNDNIMNFLYDWYEVKKRFSKKNSLPILDLGVSYYHIEKNDLDKIILAKNNKELELSDASSGLQSLTPMLVLIDYLTKGLFDDKTTESADEAKEMANIFLKHFAQLVDKDERRDVIKRQIKDENKVTLTNDEIEKISGIIASRRKYHFSQLIIEEPEQNLFPKTQRDLIYYLLERINTGHRNHNLFITTHSPYVLYALNNCMMGYSIKENMPLDEQEELASKSSWINPDLVSIWEIDNKTGLVKSIKNEKTKTVDKHYFNRVMNEVMDEYYNMLNYFE